jgi:hypothetical protein
MRKWRLKFWSIVHELGAYDIVLAPADVTPCRTVGDLYRVILAKLHLDPRGAYARDIWKLLQVMVEATFGGKAHRVAQKDLLRALPNKGLKLWSAARAAKKPARRKKARA